MALNKSTKMNPDAVFSEPYLQIIRAIEELKARQLGEHKLFEEIARLGTRILSQIAGEEKGLVQLALLFAVLSSIESWPTVRRALEERETQIWRPT